MHLLFGLSKERPILGDHPKAHIHEIRWISYGFHEIWQISGEIWWISCRFQVKPAGFHADFTSNPPDFERPIARNGKPYVFSLHPFSLFTPQSRCGSIHFTVQQCGRPNGLTYTKVE